MDWMGHIQHTVEMLTKFLSEWLAEEGARICNSIEFGSLFI
jgi:hypothetical protein